jgi:hypothetical protein
MKKLTISYSHVLAKTILPKLNFKITAHIAFGTLDLRMKMFSYGGKAMQKLILIFQEWRGIISPSLRLLLLPERLFSGGKHLISITRECLSPSTIQACQCLKSWLK